ncbi:MAG: flagellar motor switch protein FliN [Cryobacterium sp.]
MTPTRMMAVNAVEALIRVLPTATRLTPVHHSGAAPTGAWSGSVIASFVGAESVDLAIALVNPTSMDAAGGSALVSSSDVLRPALESAADVLGIGVLGDNRVEDATELFGSDEAIVFDLLGGSGVIGWFAMRESKNSFGSGSGSGARSGGADVSGKLGRIRNVEMALTVEIGRTRMSVRDVLSLEPGAVVELDRSAGAPADILLNGRLIAHGEIVVVDQDYAVRITQILDVAEGLA